MTLVLALQPLNIHVLITDAGFETVLSNVTIIHAVCFLFSSCIPEKVGINNQRGINKKWYFHLKEGVSIIEHSQPKGVKLKLRRHALRSGINWQGTLK